MTPRLQTCLDAGSVVALFPILKDWSRQELQALLVDVDEFHKTHSHTIGQLYRKTSLIPAVFFSPTLSDAVDDAADEMSRDLIIMCSEIASVALYYLEEGKETIN